MTVLQRIRGEGNTTGYSPQCSITADNSSNVCLNLLQLTTVTSSTKVNGADIGVGEVYKKHTKNFSELVATSTIYLSEKRTTFTDTLAYTLLQLVTTPATTTDSPMGREAALVLVL